jgi:hypothetical protein
MCRGQLSAPPLWAPTEGIKVEFTDLARRPEEATHSSIWQSLAPFKSLVELCQCSSNWCRRGLLPPEPVNHDTPMPVLVLECDRVSSLNVGGAAAPLAVNPDFTSSRVGVIGVRQRLEHFAFHQSMQGRCAPDVGKRQHLIIHVDFPRG